MQDVPSFMYSGSFVALWLLGGFSAGAGVFGGTERYI